MRRILIVEDDPVLRETYQIILSSQPYICDVACDGEEAVSACKAQQYDLILLDLMMPIMNGNDFLKMNKQSPFTTSKIVVLSNLSSGREVDEALHMGASKNLLKSDLSPKQLIAAVRYELRSE